MPLLEKGRTAWLRLFSPGPPEQSAAEGRHKHQLHDDLRLPSADCQNPACSSSGYGSRPALGGEFSLPWKAPREIHRFDGLNVCSRVCLAAVVQQRLSRIVAGADLASPAYRHRIPLGLLMLSRGWITREQLAGALENQKRAAQGRLGDWLIRTERVPEELVARALAAQWGVPLLGLQGIHDPVAGRLVPKLFIEVFGVVPLCVAAGRILYLAADEQIDRCFNSAIESMTGLRVEPGVLPSRAYAAARRAVLSIERPATKLFCSHSLRGIADSIAMFVTETGALSSSIVRVREYIWVRCTTAKAGVAPALRSRSGATPNLPADAGSSRLPAALSTAMSTTKSTTVLDTEFEDRIFTLPAGR